MRNLTATQATLQRFTCRAVDSLKGGTEHIGDKCRCCLKRKNRLLTRPNMQLTTLSAFLIGCSLSHNAIGKEKDEGTRSNNL
jgi:hypothetical protein